MHPLLLFKLNYIFCRYVGFIHKQQWHSALQDVQLSRRSESHAHTENLKVEIFQQNRNVQQKLLLTENPTMSEATVLIFYATNPLFYKEILYHQHLDLETFFLPKH